MKLVVFLPNWIGDTVMATPALRALRSTFLDAQIIGVMRPYVAEVLAGLSLLDRVLLYEPGRAADPSLRSGALVRRLRQERADTALLLPNSLRVAWMAFRARIPRRIGYGRDGRSFLLTDPLPCRPRHEPRPLIDEYLALAAHLGCETTSRKMELAVTPQDQALFSEFCRSQPAAWRKRRLVCLNPGGAFGAAKHWPIEHFAGLARRVAEELDRAVLVLCGPAERDQARRIVQLAGHPLVVSLAETSPSIGLTKAAVKSAELLVTTDSGPRHFAAPFGVPAVTLFGPTHPRWSDTFDPQAVAVRIDVDCGPCQQRICPLAHHRCMRELSVQQVFDAVSTRLQTQLGRDNPVDRAA